MSEDIKHELKAHTSSRMNDEIETVFNEVLSLGGLVERQFQLAVEACHTTDLEKARSVLTMDKKVNRYQAVIEGEVTRFLARRQPTAVDLRMVMMAYKMATDLERIGDEISKIAKFVIHMAVQGQHPCSSVPGYDHLMRMNEVANKSLNLCLDVFARLSVDELGQVMELEEQMDAMLRDGLSDLKTNLKNRCELVDEFLSMAQLFRAYERITDHALNIGENVFYIVKGHAMRQVSSERLDEVLEENA